MKKSSFILFGLMLLVLTDSMALSLGRHRGVALIGRPLDISVQAVLDAQEDINSLCLDADVFYADTKLVKSRVRVTAEKVSSGLQEALIHIRSTALVDEPVVTMYLRVGCQQKTERRYVLLAELVSDYVADKASPQILAPIVVAPPEGSALLLVPNGQPVNSFKQNKSRRTPKSAPPDQAASQAEAQNPLDSTVLVPNRAANSKKTTRSSPALADTKPSDQKKGSRLKLEPLDLSIERDPQLKSSQELSTSSAASPQERSAAAALWRALSAQPQDILRDAEKLQSLENSVRSLQTQSQKTQSAVDEMGIKLQQAQSERYSNWLVYVLLSLLLVALAGVVYLLSQRLMKSKSAGHDIPWWRKKDIHANQAPAWADSAPVDDMFHSDQDLKEKNKSAQLAGKLLGTDIDLSLSHADSKVDKLIASFDDVAASARVGRADFAMSIPFASRAVKAEELFDVQQQADFFVSIGQHEQAIEVLRNHIGEGVNTSALVYLDLFNLYHQLDRKDDYEALRGEFNHLFNTKIPDFDAFTAVGPGLESYQQALTRIEALWPLPKVLDVIEESIFRRAETNTEAFNLEAYRELLLLYSVAKEVIASEPRYENRAAKLDLPYTASSNADLPLGDFAATSIQPLSASVKTFQASGHPASAKPPLIASVVPPASLRLGLDIDLTQPVTPVKNSALASPGDAVESHTTHSAQTESAALPTIDVLSESLKKEADNAANLIDFDIFDASLAASEKPKSPKQ